MYCETSDVKNILSGTVEENGEEWEGTGATLLDSQIEEDIKNADAQIDMAVGKRYNVPFDPVPEAIKQLSADIAQYLSDMRYRKSREYESQNYPSILRYNRARELLEFIRSGDYTIPVEQEGATLEAVVIHAYPDPPMFGYEDYWTPIRLEY